MKAELSESKTGTIIKIPRFSNSINYRWVLETITCFPENKVSLKNDSKYFFLTIYYPVSGITITKILSNINTLENGN